MRFRIWKNFPQTGFWLCASEIFLLPVYTCTPSLRNTLNPGWRESEFTGYTLFLLFFCPSTQGKASKGSNGHVYSMPSDGRKSVCNAGDLGLIPGLGRSSGEGNGYLLQYSYLENPMQRSLAGCSPWGCTEPDMAEWMFRSRAGPRDAYF